MIYHTTYSHKQN